MAGEEHYISKNVQNPLTSAFGFIFTILITLILSDLIRGVFNSDGHYSLGLILVTVALTVEIIIAGFDNYMYTYFRSSILHRNNLILEIVRYMLNFFSIVALYLAVAVVTNNWNSTPDHPVLHSTPDAAYTVLLVIFFRYFTEFLWQFVVYPHRYLIYHRQGLIDKLDENSITGLKEYIENSITGLKEYIENSITGLKEYIENSFSTWYSGDSPDGSNEKVAEARRTCLKYFALLIYIGALLGMYGENTQIKEYLIEGGLFLLVLPEYLFIIANLISITFLFISYIPTPEADRDHYILVICYVAFSPFIIHISQIQMPLSYIVFIIVIICELIYIRVWKSYYKEVLKYKTYSNYGNKNNGNNDKDEKKLKQQFSEAIQKDRDLTDIGREIKVYHDNPNKDLEINIDDFDQRIVKDDFSLEDIGNVIDWGDRS